jgi:hypothetical protein
VADRQGFAAFVCAAEGCAEVAVDNTGAAHSRGCVLAHGDCIPAVGADARSLAVHTPGEEDSTIVPL